MPMRAVLSFIVTSVILSLIAAMPPSSRAAEGVLGTKSTQDRADTILDFLAVAFSDDLWNQDRDEEEFRNLFRGFISRLQEEPRLTEEHAKREETDPWIADFMFRQGEWPKQNAINKWQGSITIGVDWPPYGKYAQERDYSPYSQGHRDVDNGMPREQSALARYPFIVEHVKALVPTIERTTRLPVKLIEPGDPLDQTENFARIRIVPSNGVGMRNFGSTPKYTQTILDAEYQLWGGVQFSSFDPSKMDGYLLPNADNTIGLAVCKLRADLPDTLFGALITECVLRALGLPGYLDAESTSLLGFWRNPKRLSPAVIREAFRMRSLDLAPESTPAELSDLDQQMLSLLYCPAIQAGMDRNAVILTLASESTCFTTQPTNGGKNGDD